jgi:dTDP-4-dehydrorhamnose 3,5-epimerase
MNFKRIEGSDLVVITPKVFADSRGYFFESFRKDLLEEFLGEEVLFVQENESQSKGRVFRGFHYQLPPFGQAQIVRVIKGKVVDFCLDMRSSSPSFGKVFSVELSEENKQQLFMPAWYAHGFVTLTDEVVMHYQESNYYSKEHERGVNGQDPALRLTEFIDFNDFQISPRDLHHSLLQEAEKL